MQPQKALGDGNAGPKRLKIKPRAGRGQRHRLADALRCIAKHAPFQRQILVDAIDHELRTTQRKGPNLAAQPAQALGAHLGRQPATRNVAVKPLGNAAFGLFGGIAVLFQQRDRQARIETGARQIGPDPAATNDTDALQVFGRRRTNRPDCRALG